MSATLGAALAGQADAGPAQEPREEATILPQVVRLGASGGVDQWSDATIPMQSLRLYVDDDTRAGDWTYRWSYTGDLALWGTRGALDQHSALFNASPRSAWSIDTDLSGSFLLRWGDVHALASRSFGANRTGVRIGAGADLRVSEGRAHPGARTQVDLSFLPAPNLSLFMTYGASVWASPTLPLTVHDLELMLSWSPGSRTLVLLGLGALASLEPPAGPAQDPSTWVSGLPPANSVSVRQTFVAERSLNRLFFVRAELGVQEFVGATMLPHAIALGGAGVRLYRPDLPSNAGAGPFPVQLQIRAAGATRVEVIGTFTGWNAVPMWPQNDGDWTIDLTLPAGQYEYCFLIDGVATVPTESDLRRDDGFGGFNGVLIIPRPPTTGGSSDGAAALPTLQSP